ncbi:MAG: hypothetical protein ABSH28_06400 [Acidobacteriota bacterium]
MVSRLVRLGHLITVLAQNTFTQKRPRKPLLHFSWALRIGADPVAQSRTPDVPHG